MGFSTTDWVALFIFGVSALVGTLGKRLVRIIGVAVMPFAYAGLILSLSHHGSAPGQRPITNNAPSINTNNQSGGADILNIIGPQRLLFDATIGDQLASKLPAGKSIEILAVGSRTDWNIANQYAQYLKTKGIAVGTVSLLRVNDGRNITYGDLAIERRNCFTTARKRYVKTFSL